MQRPNSPLRKEIHKRYNSLETKRHGCLLNLFVSCSLLWDKMWNTIGTSYTLTNIQRFWSNFRWNHNKKGFTNRVQSQHTLSEFLRPKAKHAGKIWISRFKVWRMFNPDTSSSWQLCSGAFLVVWFLTAASGLLKDPSSCAFAKASAANKVWRGRSVEILEMSSQKVKNC